MELSKELIEQFGAEVEDGLPVLYTCDLLKITRMSYTYWLHQGEIDAESKVDSLYALFFYTIKSAYAKFIRDSKRIIRKGEAGWQGTAWWLERTNRDFQMNSDNSVISENITITTKMRKKDESGRK